MTALLVRYGVVLAVLAAGDAVWLHWFGRAVVRPTLGGILLETPRWTPVLLFYVFYAAGIVLFPLAAGLRSASWGAALGYGAAFGFLAYMTYDLTNLATLKAWTLPLAMTDMAWGAGLTGAAALAAYLAARPA
jgi:uncharacterized membrane protein